MERLERVGKICRFGGLLDELVLLMLIKGMGDNKLRKELLVERDLDLSTARDVWLTREAGDQEVWLSTVSVLSERVR